MERIITQDNVSLCTESFGNNKNSAILLLAGATVSMLYWEKEFCELLAESGFFVIRYDNRDTGKSIYYEAGTTPYSIVDLANDTMVILDNYNLDKAHFLGMSLGGLITQIVALKYPKKVATLTLFATGPWGDTDLTIPPMDKRILEFQSNSRAVDWSDENKVVEHMQQLAVILNGRKKLDTQRNEHYIRAEFGRSKNYYNMFNHAGLSGGEEYYNRLQEIYQPTLIIHGTDDLAWHFDHTNTLLKNVPNSKLVSLIGTGHELHQDDWNVIIDSITQHIHSNKL